MSKYLYFSYILYIYIVIQWEINGIYPLVMSNIAMENGPVEIVDLPSYKMVLIFHSYVTNYQRVKFILTWKPQFLFLLLAMHQTTTRGKTVAYHRSESDCLLLNKLSGMENQQPSGSKIHCHGGCRFGSNVCLVGGLEHGFYFPQ